LLQEREKMRGRNVAVILSGKRRHFSIQSDPPVGLARRP
jgi:hypothetical protein